ncbi:MAG TPA: hypothetical protein VFA18_13015, partial [Gemmataceae bacterium]|nr:hypothetical protein [Gemmataceae bacterium]
MLHSEKKPTVRATGAYDQRTLLPSTASDAPPAQVVTYASLQALMQAGLAANVAELLTLKADDVQGRDSLDAALCSGCVLTPGVPEALRRLGKVLNAACLVVNPPFPTHVPGPGESALPAFSGLSVRLASAGEIRNWSFGEVKRPETINHRTHRPQEDGLFCERIFGPRKNWECGCGKYQGMKHKGTICNGCGVKVNSSG